MAFERKKSEKAQEFNLPEFCGLPGCSNPCDVFIKYKNISRCSKHYQEDIDKWGKNHKRGPRDKSSQRMMEDRLSLYQSVTSGTRLVEILKRLYGRGDRT